MGAREGGDDGCIRCKKAVGDGAMVEWDGLRVCRMIFELAGEPRGVSVRDMVGVREGNGLTRTRCTAATGMAMGMAMEVAVKEMDIEVH